MIPYLRNLKPLLLLVAFASKALGEALLAVVAFVVVFEEALAVAVAVGVSKDGANGSLGAPDTASELNRRRWRLETKETMRDRRIPDDIVRVLGIDYCEFGSLSLRSLCVLGFCAEKGFCAERGFWIGGVWELGGL